MHAKIDCEGRDDDGTVTVSLKNGKILKARFTDQEIFVLENSTGLGPDEAEHVAGVAWAMSMDEGADACDWKRLMSRATQSLKDFEAARLRVN